MHCHRGCTTRAHLELQRNSDSPRTRRSVSFFHLSLSQSWPSNRSTTTTLCQVFEGFPGKFEKHLRFSRSFTRVHRTDSSFDRAAPVRLLSSSRAASRRDVPFEATSWRAKQSVYGLHARPAVERVPACIFFLLSASQQCSTSLHHTRLHFARSEGKISVVSAAQRRLREHRIDFFRLLITVQRFAAF